MELYRADLLTIKLPVKQCNTVEGKEQNELWKDVTGERDTKKLRKPFEDAIAEKQNKLRLLENFSSAF